MPDNNNKTQQGISLVFDDDGNAEIDSQTKPKMHMCFGGIMCDKYLPNPTKFTLADGSEIMADCPVCIEVDQPIVNIYHCPIKKWFKLAAPIGAAGFTPTTYVRKYKS